MEQDACIQIKVRPVVDQRSRCPWWHLHKSVKIYLSSSVSHCTQNAIKTINKVNSDYRKRDSHCSKRATLVKDYEDIGLQPNEWLYKLKWLVELIPPPWCPVKLSLFHSQTSLWRCSTSITSMFAYGICRFILSKNRSLFFSGRMEKNIWSVT